MISFFKLTLKNKPLMSAFLVAILLIVFGYIIRFWVYGDNISEPLQTVLISLGTTVIAYISGKLAEIGYLYKKYINIAGVYDGYAYQEEHDVKSDKFYRLEKKRQSIAEIKYIGGSDFNITLSVKHPPEISDLTWKGDFKVTSSNMAEIGWWYVNERVKFEIGLKRAVLHDNTIVLFSDGSSVHRREVLIKRQ